MLKINLLTERKAAEKWYYRWKLGDLCVDWLSIDQDLIVRRRFNQERRNRKKSHERAVQRRLRRYQRFLSTLKRKTPIQAPTQTFFTVERVEVGLKDGSKKEILRRVLVREKRAADRVGVGVVTMKNGLEPERTSLDYEKVPVPEPTRSFERNAVHGRQRVSWARGNPKATKQRVTNKQ